MTTYFASIANQQSGDAFERSSERTSNTKVVRYSGDWGFASRTLQSPTSRGVTSHGSPALWNTEAGPESIKRHSDPTTSPRIDEGYDTLRSSEKVGPFHFHSVPAEIIDYHLE